MTPQWVLMKFLENWTAADLYYIIKNDVTLNLKPFWSMIENAVVESILSMFKETRSDLYEVLNTSEGRAWLKKNIRAVLQR